VARKEGKKGGARWSVFRCTGRTKRGKKKIAARLLYHDQLRRGEKKGREKNRIDESGGVHMTKVTYVRIWAGGGERKKEERKAGTGVLDAKFHVLGASCGRRGGKGGRERKGKASSIFPANSSVTTPIEREERDGGQKNEPCCLLPSNLGGEERETGAGSRKDYHHTWKEGKEERGGKVFCEGKPSFIPYLNITI